MLFLLMSRTVSCPFDRQFWFVDKWHAVEQVSVDFPKIYRGFAVTISFLTNSSAYNIVLKLYAYANVLHPVNSVTLTQPMTFGIAFEEYWFTFFSIYKRNICVPFKNGIIILLLCSLLF